MHNHYIIQRAQKKGVLFPFEPINTPLYQTRLTVSVDDITSGAEKHEETHTFNIIKQTGHCQVSVSFFFAIKQNPHFKLCLNCIQTQNSESQPD